LGLLFFDKFAHQIASKMTEPTSGAPKSSIDNPGTSSKGWSVKLKKIIAKLKLLIVDPNETDLTKSLSIGLGIFISIVPLWGFQTLVAVATAFIFRLNKPLVIAASYFSVPPMTPFILYLSVVVGGLFVSKPVVFNVASIGLDVLQSALIQYVIGSVVLATFTAVLFGGGTLLLLRSRR
jgi:uncharacterized protein (DUF2062 family)